MPRLSLLLLLFFSAGAYAERINDPMRVLEQGNGECAGAGFFLWDSGRCLFKDDSIFWKASGFGLRGRRTRLYGKRNKMRSRSEINIAPYIKASQSP